ncbi:hypothetical protein ACRRTK_015393 [Alexandromys fortis]
MADPSSLRARNRTRSQGSVAARPGSADADWRTALARREARSAARAHCASACPSQTTARAQIRDLRWFEWWRARLAEPGPRSSRRRRYRVRHQSKGHGMSWVPRG